MSRHRLREAHSEQEQIPDFDSIEDFPIPIPTIEARKSIHRDHDTNAQIIRDFAYPFDDDRFYTPAEPPDTTSELSSDDLDPIQDHGGFQGAPPWLQLAGKEGLVSEEDLTTASADEIHGQAVALFDFEPEHENEFALVEGQVIYISSRHGQGWLVAVDMTSHDCGLVPEEYVKMLPDDGKTTISTPTIEITDANEWVDEPESIDSNNQKAGPSDSPAEMTEEERRKILIQAERDMAMAEHQNLEHSLE